MRDARQIEKTAMLCSTHHAYGTGADIKQVLKRLTDDPTLLLKIIIRLVEMTDADTVIETTLSEGSELYLHDGSGRVT